MDFGVWMVRQRYSPRTIKAYGRQLERVEAWLRHRRRTLRSASWKQLREYAETLPLSHASRMALQSAMKAYWRFLGRPDCPAWAVPTPKKPRMVPRPVDDGELERVFNTARTMGPTAFCVVACLYYLGLRREEAATLRWAQVREDGRVHIVGKGGIEAYLPTHPEVTKALSRLSRRSEYVFPGQRGGHIAPGTVNHWVKIISDLSGVAIHPHRFRHTAITNGYLRTEDVFATQTWARHADPRTTRGYTAVPWQRVEAVAAVL